MARHDIDRERGILTETDRRYLLGLDNREGQDERNTRYRIRQRVKNSLKDLEIVAKQMDSDDLDNVLDDLDQKNIEELRIFLDSLADYADARVGFEETRAEIRDGE